jgi:MFS family permease
LAVLLAVWAMYGANTVLIYTIAMDSVRPGREGTDYTIQIVLVHLGSMLMAVLSGKWAHHFGYRGLFILVLVLQLILVWAIPYLYVFKTDKNEN